jgi:hypothetical protein
MPLPERIRQQIEPIVAGYCARIVPEHARQKVKIRYTFRGNSITIVEEPPDWRKPDLWIKMPVAQFRYDPKSDKWTLYCADRNSRWHHYLMRPERDIRVLLREVGADPVHIFWG